MRNKVVKMSAHNEPNDVPSQSEWGQLRSWLAQNGFSQQWINDNIGNNRGNRERSVITDDLIDGYEVLPKS